MRTRTIGVVANGLEHVAPWLVLAILLTYTYVEFFYAPYLGFNFNPSTGDIQEVFVITSEVQAGDKIYAIDDLLFDDWAKSLRQPLFDHTSPGETVVIRIERNDLLKTVEWNIPGPLFGEVFSRVINIWFLGYSFWLTGMVTIFSLRPKNFQQRLFAAFFFLTAIWIISGNTSRWNLWEASIVFRMAIWLCLPVYLHLHWSFPKNLRPVPVFVFPGIYLIGICAALLQWFELLPKRAYTLGFIVALLGSFCFLLIHFVGRSDERRKVAVILYSFIFALLPSAGLSVAASLNSAPRLSGVTLLALPIIPIGYLYAIYRHQLGGVEIRTNRRITLFLYLILLGSSIVVLNLIVLRLPDFPGRFMLATLAVSLGTAWIALKSYHLFEGWIEKHFFGIPYPTTSLFESYLSRITTSLTKTELVQILKNEILPSLLIRQSALLLFNGERFDLLYFQGIKEGNIPPLSHLSSVTGNLQSHAVRVPQKSGLWVRIGIPLILNEQKLGLWLLGRHDPDDFYTDREIAILENIAKQTTMALVNIEQAEQLQLFYHADIQRHEIEQTRLAHTLHDEILNQAAIAYTSLDSDAISDKFEREYNLLKQQIRHMIGDLRPVTLNWGLQVALEELVDSLNERSNGLCTIVFAMPESQARYPVQVEEQIFRIVQQACENSLRHANANLVQIGGRLQENRVEIYVEDDGAGFKAGETNLSNFLEHKHFGLAGMYERAKIIKAQFHIESDVDHGTAVQVIWSNELTVNSLGLG